MTARDTGEAGHGGAVSILRVFPRRTSHTPDDDMAFVGDPPLWRPEADEVHVSVTFTWDIAEGQRLAEAWAQYYPAVRIGGPAMGSKANGFTAGRYVRQGVTFTSRGCNNRCGFCLVPEREGQLQPIADFEAGHIINDNNFLQCPADHRARVYAMLRQQSKAAVFSGGLQASLVTDVIAEEFRGIRIDSVFLAADTEAAIKPLQTACERLAFLGREKLRCYALCAYGDDTPEQAERRMVAIWEAGAMPFAQLYQPPEQRIAYSAEWRSLVRTWSRPAAMKARMRELATDGAIGGRL